MKPGPKPKGKVAYTWTPAFAYAIGLLTADGCLYNDGRHIDLTSKDKAQVELFRKCLGLKTKIGIKNSGAGNQAYHTQFGDVLFYNYLLDIGLTPAKSKTLGALKIPSKYFFHFLRGYFDGDGCSYSYYDTVFKKSFRFYISFASASPKFFEWLQKEIYSFAGVKGAIGHDKSKNYFQLRYAKKEAQILCKKMYARAGSLCLERKHLKIMKSMCIIEGRRGGEIGRHATFRS